MGQAIRTTKYDRAANIANAVPALEFNGTPLKWYRLDDGVMGGCSETLHESTSSDVAALHFKGTINTNGGGFTSIRAPLPDSCFPSDTKAIRIRYRGDGKTYKVLLSAGGSAGSPFARSPSWQADLPTKKDDTNFTVMTLPLNTFRPSFGPGVVHDEDKNNYMLVPSEIREIGLMLSLKLSDGSPNPPETFGEGIFDFSLFVDSLEPVLRKESLETCENIVKD